MQAVTGVRVAFREWPPQAEVAHSSRPGGPWSPIRSSRPTLRGALSMGRVAIVVLLALAVARPVLAQQDTSPPVLLDFTASPVVFDTGPSAVTVQWCTTARDDLSGVRYLAVYAGPGANGFDYGGSSWTCDQNNGPCPLEKEICGPLMIPRYAHYGEYYLHVYLCDAVNCSTYHPTMLDLCAVGTCTVDNRNGSSATADADADGTPDDADNCRDVANPDQADRDVDLIGDACDPFPDDRDNVQAQCEADLGQSKRDAKQAARKLERVRGELAAERADADGDGVRDAPEDCPATKISAEVDKGGCSLAQFCARVDATTSLGRKACKRSDWKNDEPLMNLLTEADCAVDGAPTADSADDRCVSATP